MKKISLVQAVLLLFILLGLDTRAVRADNWQASIYEESAPGKLVGVDKKHRTFNFYEKKSPLRLRYSYPCVTGQLQGDKQHLNDLRTPEGVYFVEYKIANGLDFKEYGGIAYTLNYPNPVDRLRGKTGYGIWIHSKGFELVPTRGCVAINLKNIAEVGPLLSPGTPVVLAEELKSVTGHDDGAQETLRALMRDWSSAWAGRSERLFDFYDPEAYSKATENFTLFRQNKERLFKILSFIKIYNREIHVLEGPGYWVTWSEQLYTASNLSTEGVRRLYWQKGNEGKFRIVGMEWTPREMGMRAEVQQGRLVAENSPTTLVDAESEAPVPPRLDMPEAPQLATPVQSDAVNDSARNITDSLRASITALAKNLLNISEPLKPGRLPNFTSPGEIDWGKGQSLSRPADNAPQEKPQAPASSKTPATNIQENAPKEDMAAKNTAPVNPDAELQALRKLVNVWGEAYKNRDETITKLYDRQNYNRLAKLGVAMGPSYANTLQSIRRDFNQPWFDMMVRPANLELHGPVAKSLADIMIIGPGGIRQGVQTLWWHKDKDGEYRVVGSGFSPRNLGMEANYLEQISGDVSRTIEDWRKSWESARLEDYLEFYTTDAIQQGRSGRKNIQRQKEALWQRKKPVQVQLTGLRLAIDQRGIRADMTQNYEDSTGHKDKGVKTLLLKYDGQKWQIRHEDWVNSAPVAVAPANPSR